MSPLLVLTLFWLRRGTSVIIQWTLYGENDTVEGGRVVTRQSHVRWSDRGRDNKRTRLQSEHRLRALVFIVAVQKPHRSVPMVEEQI